MLNEISSRSRDITYIHCFTGTQSIVSPGMAECAMCGDHTGKQSGREKHRHKSLVWFLWEDGGGRINKFRIGWFE